MPSENDLKKFSSNIWSDCTAFHLFCDITVYYLISKSWCHETKVPRLDEIRSFLRIPTPRITYTATTTSFCVDTRRLGQVWSCTSVNHYGSRYPLNTWPHIGHGHGLESGLISDQPADGSSVALANCIRQYNFYVL